METYIAILRGINVSGTKKIRMEDLRVKLTDMGFRQVKTYIQSGNVVFDHEKTDPLELAKRFEQIILDEYGFAVPVIITDADALEYVLTHNPFLNDRNEEADKLHVTFLAEAPADEKINKLDDKAYLPDEFIFKNNAIYLFCPNGYGRTKLTNNFFESKLKVTATTRNWKTVNALVELAKITTE